MTRAEILSLISSASLSGNLGLFIGSGFTKAALQNSLEYRAYTWKELLEKCCEEMGVPADVLDCSLSNPELASRICRSYEQFHKRERVSYFDAMDVLKEQIASLVSVFPNESTQEKLSPFFQKFDISWIITTNYDTVLESLLKEKSYSIGPEDLFIMSKDLIPIYHIHGVRHSPHGIVVTNEDYAKLFRPDDYRQARLPFLIKESLVLMVGYNLGDLNVLTAVDWAKNVYQGNGAAFPIVQLLYKDDGTINPDPYENESGIWILEIKDIPSFFEEALADLDIEKTNRGIRIAELFEKKNYFINAQDEEIKQFIDSKEKRLEILQFMASLNRSDYHLYLEFESFLRKVMSELVRRSLPYNAFSAYNEKLVVIIDIFITISLNKMPVSFFGYIAKELDMLAYYVGEEKGKCYQAYSTWKTHIKHIPQNILLELKRYSAGKRSVFTNLDRLLNMADENSLSKEGEKR